MVHYQLQQLLKVVVVQVLRIKLFGTEIGRVQSLKIIESGVEHQQSISTNFIYEMVNLL